LSKYLVEIEKRISPPEYLENYPIVDLSPLLFLSSGEAGEIDPNMKREDAEALVGVNVLEEFPKIPNSTMDDSQLGALERMLTKSVAIVQGPPGTGKTFVSVSALKVMLANTDPTDGPILVAAQTNHALDQLLSHCAKFEPDFVRLGGRFDKENLDIKNRSLFELRTNTPDFRGTGWGVYKEMKNRVAEIQMDLAPLCTEEMLMAETLLAHDIITKDQYESLHEKGWTTNESSENDENEARGPIAACKIPVWSRHDSYLKLT
jgi:helicase required for RNAi-mediated heterochromatin assembly 1